MFVGDARVSTPEQTLARHHDALPTAGWARVFPDPIRGATSTTQDRGGLTAALAFLRPGDTLVGWQLDRWGRARRHLMAILNALQERGIGFQSLTEQIDTPSSGGKLIVHVFGALAEFERDLIRERTHAGLPAARARGRYGARPRLDAKKRKMLRALDADTSNSVAAIVRPLPIAKSTLYRYINADQPR